MATDVDLDALSNAREARDNLEKQGVKVSLATAAQAAGIAANNNRLVSSIDVEQARKANEEQQADSEQSKAQKAADERLTAQCILLDGIDVISPKNFKQRYAVLNSNTVGMEGDRATFASSINGSKLKSKFLDFTTAQLASLTPVIKLYKVIQNDKGTTTDYLIPFSTHTAWRSGLTTYGTVEDLLLEGRERPMDVGIKSFSWTFEGTNPVSSRRDISAKLILFSNNLNNLIEQFNIYPSDPNAEKTSHCFKYIDLVLRSGKKFNPVKQFNPQYYTIKIQIAWKTQNILLFPDEEQRKSLEKNTTTMLLTLIDHNFNFNQDGTVSLTLDYRAYFEGLLFSEDADILKSAEQTIKLDKIKDELTLLKEEVQPSDEDDATPPPDKKQYDDKLKEYSDFILEINKTAYPKIINKLRSKNQIYCVEIDIETYNQYKNSLSTANPATYVASFQPTQDNPIIDIAVSNANAVIGTTTVDQKNPDLTNLFPVEKDGYKYITYFYLNDLFNSVIEECYIKLESLPNKPKFLFGSALYYSIDKSAFDLVNILDIPVSLEWFSEWFANTIVSQNKTSYPILYFIRDMCSKLINNILSNTCDKTKILRAKNKFNIIDFNVSLLPGLDSPNNDPIYQERLKQQQLDSSNIPIEELIKICQTYEPLKGSDTKNNQQYIAVYCQDISSPTKVNCAEDHKNGIYHFYFGRDRGLVKSINFTRSSTTGLREANYGRESSGKDYEQLMLPYDVEMKMIGNNLFSNGMMIFIDPSGFGRKFGTPDDPGSFSYQLKLGGYHTIYRIESSITTSGFETSVKARWTGSGTKSILTAKPKPGTPAAGGATIESVSEAPSCSEYDSGFNYPDSSPIAPVSLGTLVRPGK
jgi:hypothetical protein